MIGITGTRHLFQLKIPGQPLQGVTLSDDYAHGVEQAGGIPVVIPYLESPNTVYNLAEQLDGLVLSGGNDVDPSLFGAEPKVGLQEVSPDRDFLEILLFKTMRAQGKPVLGICRGMQLVNAALGGTLYQDLSREWKGSIQHAQRSPRNHVSHTVYIEPKSRLASLLCDMDQTKVNSFHHQAVERVASGMMAVAWDDEGLTEGMEAADGPFLVAVQWHPENLWRVHPVFLGLFTGLVEAAVQQNESVVSPR